MLKQLNALLCATLLLATALVAPCALSGYSYYKQRHHNRRDIEYRLVDIGTTDLPPPQLSKHALPLSHAPAINGKGQVIFNDLKGGVLWDPLLGRKRLRFERGYAHFHDINEEGTVLASLGDIKFGLTWLLWPEDACGERLTPANIDVCAYQDHHIYFRTLNDNGTVAGLYIPQGGALKDAKALVHVPEKQCAKQLWQLCDGVAWAASPQGYVVANSAAEDNNAPYLWHPKRGFLVVGDDMPAQCRPPADARYVDLVINCDNSVYGTYLDHTNGRLEGFFWDPFHNFFKKLDLMAMRISGVNSCGTLVGNVGPAAVVRHRNGATMNLSRLVDVKGVRWQLLEATDINDLGQIVGYGLADGEMHIFLLEPVEQPVTKIYYNP